MNMNELMDMNDSWMCRNEGFDEWTEWMEMNDSLNEQKWRIIDVQNEWLIEWTLMNEVLNEQEWMIYWMIRMTNEWFNEWTGIND